MWEPPIGQLPRLERLWADDGYAGQLVGWVRARTGWESEIVKRPDAAASRVLPPTIDRGADLRLVG